MQIVALASGRMRVVRLFAPDQIQIYVRTALTQQPPP